MTPKSLLRHELLNNFTVLSLSMQDEESLEEYLPHMRELVKSCSLLVSYEALFLGEEYRFFFQEFDLTELLEVAYGSLVRSGYELEGDFPDNFSVRVDRQAFHEVLMTLLESFEGSETVVVKSDVESSSLRFHHSREAGLFEGLSSDILQPLKEKPFSLMRLRLGLARKLLEEMGVSWKDEASCFQLFFSAD